MKLYLPSAIALVGSLFVQEALAGVLGLRATYGKHKRQDDSVPIVDATPTNVTVADPIVTAAAPVSSIDLSGAVEVVEPYLASFTNAYQSWAARPKTTNTWKPKTFNIPNFTLDIKIQPLSAVDVAQVYADVLTPDANMDTKAVVDWFTSAAMQYLDGEELTTSANSTTSSSLKPSTSSAARVASVSATPTSSVASSSSASSASSPTATSLASSPAATSSAEAETSEPSALVLPLADNSTEVGSGAPVSTSGKRGIAFNNARLVNGFVGQSSQVTWAYNWGSTTSGIPSSVEYVPMLWGPGSDHTINWIDAASSALASGSTHLLAFNEPDHSEQAATTPEICASSYRQWIEPFAGKARLGAPAVTNGGAPMGLAYLKEFLSACSDCTVDFIPIHWYAPPDVSYFKSHIQAAYEAGGGRPIWITEFGAEGSLEEQDAFLREVIPWLDSTSYIERYAYFYADGVLTSGGLVSSLGNTFMSYSASTK